MSQHDCMVLLLREKIQSIADCRLPQFAVTVVSRDKILLCEIFNNREDSNLNLRTVHQLASISKIITTTIIVIETTDSELEERIDLATSLAPTRLEALSHITSIPSCCGDYQKRVGYSREEVKEQLVACLNESSNARSFSYQNYIFSLAAEELVSRSSYYRFFNDIGMIDASLGRSAFDKCNNKASSYLLDVQQPSHDGDDTIAASGINGSIGDMASFLQYHLLAAVTPTSNYYRLLTPRVQRDSNTKRSYGLGINIDVVDALTIYSHSGALEVGTHSHLMWIPEKNIGLAVLTNTIPTGFVEGLSAYLVALVNDESINSAEDKYLRREQEVNNYLCMNMYWPPHSSPIEHFCRCCYASRTHGTVELRPPNLIRVGRTEWSEVVRIEQESQLKYMFLITTSEGQIVPADVVWNEEQLTICLMGDSVQYTRCIEY